MKKAVLIIFVLFLSSFSFAQEFSPKDMVIEKVSPYTLDETVKLITENAEKQNWTVSGVKELEKSILKHGGIKVLPVRLVELCHPEHSSKILKNDNVRFVSVFMPCTISVYEKADGKTYAAFMNTKMIGQMFGGIVEEVFSGPVNEAQTNFLSFLK